MKRPHQTKSLMDILQFCCLSVFFQGRLNELMSQIRMQNHFGAVRSEERYNVDADLLREIKQVSHYICTVNRSMPYTVGVHRLHIIFQLFVCFYLFSFESAFSQSADISYKMKLSALHRSSTE